MSTEYLPQLRSDIQVSVYQEDGQSYVILFDVMGFADGPIMVHADMMGILESCDGETTWNQIAESSNVELDGPEVLKVRAFLGELDQLGFFETHYAEVRKAQALDEWDNLTERPEVCAGSTYPADPAELSAFLDTMLSDAPDAVSPLAGNSAPSAYLIPHIDFRVAPHMYGPAFKAIGSSEADLFVMIGTSHYWSGDRIILTRKDYRTPLGTLTTDRALADELETALNGLLKNASDTPHTLLVCESDLAHKPEHSIELHAVLLQHVLKDRPFTILPILVTGFGGEEDENGFHDISVIATAVKDVVTRSGKKACWIISGDLAHVGPKFGDPMPADILLPSVQEADRDLIGMLEAGDVDGYHQAIELTDQSFRICGHAPTVLALQAIGPVTGKQLAYDLWDDKETRSAVTFATMAFGGTVPKP